jgi:hypothetical protein
MITAQRLDSIERGITADRLNEEAREAFEEKAMMKLMDLGDYFSIYADSELDNSFRNIGRSAVEKLFLDTVRLWNIKLKKFDSAKDYKLSYCLDRVKELPLTSMGLRIDSIRTVEGLHRSNDGAYKGILGFTQSIIAYSKTDSFLLERAPKLIDIFVFKVDMKIDIDSLRPWKVLLGDIRDIDKAIMTQSPI